ncbi:MAG: DNA translocase FtsK, partial [Planctomycetota bacterium]
EEEQPEPVPNAEAEAAEAEPEAEIPVLENVNETGKKSGVLRSIFSKKDKPAKRSGDPLLDESAALVIEKGRASVVFLQRRLDIGYTRASRLIDAMERNGLVGPLEESGSREVLMTVEEWEEVRG